MLEEYQIMKYNGTKHDLAWEESQYPAWEWSDFVSAPITYTPTAPNVEIVGVDEMNQNTTTEFIADINGGGGKYGIKWLRRDFPSGEWLTVKNNPEPDYFEIPCGSDNRYYYYDDEYKVDLTIGTQAMELKVEISDEVLAEIYSDTIIISLKPEPVIVRNILDSQDYGQLSVNSATYNSGDVVNLDVYEYHNFETYDDFQNGTYLFRVWDYGENEKSYLHADNLFIDKSQTVASSFHPTLPLTVTNNLEGGEGGTWQVKWDKKTTFEDPVASSNPFYAFDNTETEDLYTLKVENIDNTLNTDWQFLYWEDDITKSATRTEAITNTNKQFTANYKGQFRSQSADAFNSNSQRKLVRTNDGIYHLVYSSLGKVWHTQSLSADFAGNWDHEINYSNQINSGKGGTNPSIDYFGNDFVVVYEEDNGSGGYSIMLETSFGSGEYSVAALDAAYYGQEK